MRFYLREAAIASAGGRAARERQSQRAYGRVAPASAS
jgi:hypothetical protein